MTHGQRSSLERMGNNFCQPPPAWIPELCGAGEEGTGSRWVVQNAWYEVEDPPLVGVATAHRAGHGIAPWLPRHPQLPLAAMAYCSYSRLHALATDPAFPRPRDRLRSIAGGARAGTAAS